MPRAKSDKMTNAVRRMPARTPLTLQARLGDSAMWRANDLGYRVTGLRGYDEVTRSRGVAFFQLTRGCLIITADGEDSTWQWYPLLAVGEVKYEEEKTRVRASTPCVG